MRKSWSDNLPYRLRYQMSLIIVLVCINLIFFFFPSDWRINQRDLPFNPDSDQQITLIDITRQDATPTEISRPRIRLDTRFVTSDIYEPELDIVLSITEGDFNVLPLPSGSGSQVGIVPNPTRSARVSRIVEAVTPSRIIQSNDRFRVYVRFLIDSRGNVEEIFITEIQRYDFSLQEFVRTLDSHPDIAEATMEAAVQWRFRPAEQNGEPVRSFSTHIFSFGR